MEPESALITKLHAKLSLFRRDRDDAHRRKELAVERARIVKQDRENAAAEVRAMQNKLVEMKDDTKEKMREVGFVEREVEKMTMEYKFQHSELNTKREKLSNLASKVSAESASRSSTVSSSREALRKRRDISSGLNAPDLSLDEKKRQLEALVEGEGGEEFLASLADWIAKRTNSFLEEGEDIRRGCLATEKKILGYKAAVGEVDAFASVAVTGEQ